jgi:hypothetical protein
MDRDPELERELLELAGGNANYARQVLARLDQFEHDNGGNLDGWEQDVDQILAEAQEEGADVTGWLIGVLLQRPDLRDQVLVAIRHAAAAHCAVEEIRLEIAVGGT